MNERQEAQWLYAKGLELAVMLKGASRKEVTEGSVETIIDEYDDIAGRIVGRIKNTAEKMLADKLL